MMGLFAIFSSCKNEPDSASAPSSNRSLTVDLINFRIGETELGSPPSANDFFTTELLSSKVFEDPSQGLELGAKEDGLDYLFLTVDHFNGKFLLGETPLEIDTRTTEEEIKQHFGEPYWTDKSEGETILFYEYRQGAIELQFEFPASGNLAFMTLTRDGVLATAEQRKSYQVNKPWPPE